MLDVLIRGGTLVDGTGGPPIPGDLGVRAGRIVALGPLADRPAARVLEAAGQIVAPGFIDIHGHSDFTILADPRACSAITQGVTTEVIGNCGHGCAPTRDPAHARANVYGAHPAVSIDWRTWEEYLGRIVAAAPAINVAPLVAHGALRLAALGWAERPATPTELAAMERLTDEVMDAGAFGLSTGLEYVPGRHADEQELVTLCRIVAARGGLHATHVRNRDDRAVEAIDEVIRIAARAGVALQISHLIPRNGAKRGDTTGQAIAAVDAARASGQDVTFDIHTRTYSLLKLAAALPSFAFEGGTADLRRRLADPAQRAEMAGTESIVTQLVRFGGWDQIVLRLSAGHPEWVGRSFQAISEEAGVSPFDVLCEVVADEPTDPMAPLLTSPVHTEAELELAIRHPAGLIGSDATVLATDGPLAEQVFPGAFTWAAWFYRYAVRDRNILPLAQAIHKLTELPARRVGISDRGVLRPGAWADVAVFDPAAFGERGTVDAPNRYAVGMTHVLVNGRPAMVDGVLTSERGGRVLMKGSA